tara:strand:- start:594 stop:1148 length:555 start_codon:yes stop_codon:yes gene_type:complete
MKHLLLAPLIFSLGLFAKAEVNPKIHEMCLQAKDYLGCVQAQKSGVNLAGNSCPLGFAYSGNGSCREVTCVMRGSNHPDLGGKDYACGNAPFWSGFIGRMVLSWGEETVQATLDSSCPNKKPDIGWRSTCTQSLGAEVTPHYVGGVLPKKKSRKPLACRNGTWSQDHPKCKESEGKVTSPMDME